MRIVRFRTLRVDHVTCPTCDVINLSVNRYS